MFIQLQAYWKRAGGSFPPRVDSTDVEHCHGAQDIRDFRARATNLAKDGSNLTFHVVEAYKNGFIVDEIDLDKVLEDAEAEEATEHHDRATYHRAQSRKLTAEAAE